VEEGGKGLLKVYPPISTKEIQIPHTRGRKRLNTMLQEWGTREIYQLRRRGGKAITSKRMFNLAESKKNSITRPITGKKREGV